MTAESDTYLTVPYRDKNLAKGLGARWDAAVSQWFVPAGLALPPFAQWMVTSGADSTSTAVAVSSPSLPATTRGTSLTALLTKVSGVVQGAFPDTVWVRAEISEIKRPMSGHLYLTLVEHNAAGKEIAKVGAALWAGRARKVVSEFCKETGADFAPGIKVLLETTVRFSPRGGLSLEVVSIDASFTLGELEAKLRRIRQQLTSEGVLEANKQLVLPGDFFRVIVISPEEAAGLGDFRAESSRLEKHGLCTFIYRSAVFQGENASASVSAAIASVVDDEADALVVIRGGGAVSDLHWLSDLDIARAVCRCPLPVLVGVGHEKDSTILDELACRRFGTPSKVIGFIEATIRGAAEGAGDSFALIERAAQRAIDQASKASEQAITLITESVQHGVALAATNLDSRRDIVLGEARRAVPDALRRLEATMQQQIAVAGRLLAVAQTRHDAAFEVLRTEPTRIIAKALEAAELAAQTVAREAGKMADRAAMGAGEARTRVQQGARSQLELATRNAEQSMKIAIGLGPERTLKRGFALIWAGDTPVTSRAEASTHSTLAIQFHDGKLSVQPKE